MTESKTVLLIPGLFSPRWHMGGLRRALERRGFAARVWDEASVFGDLEQSVADLQQCLDEQDFPVGIVTHSFGDWLFRQVAARHGVAQVSAVVSLVPVVSSSLVASLLEPLGAIAPEIAVMANEDRAASALHLPDHIERLVLWSSIDPWVRRAPRDAMPNARTVIVRGTHNTVLWQPGVHRIVAEYLNATLRAR